MITSCLIGKHNNLRNAVTDTIQLKILFAAQKHSYSVVSVETSTIHNNCRFISGVVCLQHMPKTKYYVLTTGIYIGSAKFSVDDYIEIADDTAFHRREVIRFVTAKLYP